MARASIATGVLQSMVSKSVRGAGKNKVVPITSMIGVTLKSRRLTLTTTDGANYLYTYEDGVVGDEFSVTVDVDRFAALVARLTCDEVGITVDDSCMTIRGNGTYKLALQMESGVPVVYPDVASDADDADADVYEVLPHVVDLALTTLKSSLLVNSNDTVVDVSSLCYTGYYCGGNKVITSNSIKVACLPIPLLADRDVLISAEMMELVGLMRASESISATLYGDGMIRFDGDGIYVYGPLMQDIDRFNISAIDRLLTVDFAAERRISKAAVLQALSRVAIFVESYDKNNAVVLHFGAEEDGRYGVEIASKSTTGVEFVPFSDSGSAEEFSVVIDATLLATQIKSTICEDFTICYGNPNLIKIVTDDTVMLIATIAEM